MAFLPSIHLLLLPLLLLPFSLFSSQLNQTISFFSVLASDLH